MYRVVDYTHKKQTAGAGQFARVKLSIASGDSGSGFSFTNLAGGGVPPEFVPGVEKAARDMIGNMDVSVELLDGAYHSVDSSVLAFEIATRYALTKAFDDMGTPLANPWPPKQP